MALKAPFPYFGGKARAAGLVWQRLGNAPNYVEPFAGSLAVLLQRPFPARTETINDADCFVQNFWRAIKVAPDEVAAYADHPVLELDLHARHLWLVNQHKELKERFIQDPDYYDAQIAGWWVWGISCWIGGGWCNTDKSPKRSMPMFGDRPTAGGIHRLSIQRPNLRPKQGVNGLPRNMPYAKTGGRGGHRTHPPRQVPHLSGDSGAAGAGIHSTAFDRKTGGLYAYFNLLADRLRYVRVVCGDWSRICGPSVTYKIGLTAVFLDPPYSDRAGRESNLYAQDSLDVAHQVRAWCLEEIKDETDGRTFCGPRYLHPKLRIALCGYDGEHNELEALGWEVVAWKTNGGYSNQGENKGKNGSKERIWFSPACLRPETEPRQLTLGGL